MFNKKLVFSSLLGLAFSGSASAVPIIIEGNFVRTQISDDGTLGSGSANPGLIHDPSGTGDFSNDDDYLRPGSPFEGFGISYTGSGGVLENNNNGSDDFAGSLVDMSGTGADNRVVWTGGNADLEIVHDFFFNNDEERINIATTITAVNNVESLLASRAIDPDPDVINFFTFSTDNTLGLDANSDGDFADSGDASTSDFVGSVGTNSGQTLGIFSASSIAHSVGIVGSCCSELDPLAYLSGGDFPAGSSSGDHGIGIGFDIGALLAGESVTLEYAYVMGGTLETVDIPDDGGTDPIKEIPEPATALMLALGGAAVARRRKRSN